MNKIALVALIAFSLIPMTIGCEGATDSKQPKLSGPPDPKVQGPAALPSDPGGNNKSGAAAQ